jgi:hypothetical protein
MKRLLIAAVAYAGLGVLAYKTLPDERIRLMTFAILALFAVRTFLHRRELMQDERKDDSAG